MEPSHVQPHVSHLPAPPAPPFVHRVRRWGSAATLAAAVVSMAGAFAAIAERNPHDIKPGGEVIFTIGVLISQIGGLAAIAFGAVGLYHRWRRPVLAGLAIPVGVFAGFLGFNAFFSG